MTIADMQAMAADVGRAGDRHAVVGHAVAGLHEVDDDVGAGTATPMKACRDRGRRQSPYDRAPGYEELPHRDEQHPRREAEPVHIGAH